MLKKIAVILLLFVTTTLAKIIIGGSGGALNFGENDEWGWGAGVRTKIKLAKRFDISFSVAHTAWDKEYLNNYDLLESHYEIQATAVSLDILYYLNGEKLKPYLNLCHGYHFGYVKDTFHRYDPYTFELEKYGILNTQAMGRSLVSVVE